MESTRVIDSQVHIWAAETADRLWRPSGASYAHRDEPFGVDELLREMSATGVDGAVLVPPSWEGDRNDLALSAAAAYPRKFAVMGRLPIDDEQSRDRLKEWRAQPGMLGIRLAFNRDPERRWLRDGTADWVWNVAEVSAIPVMVYAPGATDQLERIASQHPGLRLIVDHAGLPVNAKGQAVEPFIDSLLKCAAYPNIAVKASALPCATEENYPFPSIHRLVCRLVREFSANRVFWGSDLTRLPCPYRECLDLFQTEIACLSTHDREWVLGRGITEWLDWKASAD